MNYKCGRLAGAFERGNAPESGSELHALQTLRAVRSSSASSQQGLKHIAMHVRQASVDPIVAEGKLCMFDS